MGLAVSCPRCGGQVRPPGLMRSGWFCDRCGDVQPLYGVRQANEEIVAVATARAARDGIPVWCPWPLPSGWMITGLGWVGDERQSLSATAVVCSGPTPFSDGPADLVLVAEDLGVGLGARLAGIPGPDPGPALDGAMSARPADAKVRAAGRPTPLWSVAVLEDRSAYVGEALGRWLYAVTWPAQAGYLLAEELQLRDLAEWMPSELVYGAASGRLLGNV